MTEIGRMIVRVYRDFEVDYNGKSHKEHALNSLRVSPRNSEGSGHSTTEINKPVHPSATYHYEIVSDIQLSPSQIK